MKILWTFTLMMIPGVVSSINETGYSGDQLNITCTYDDTYIRNAKYFCRGQWLQCKDQIRTETKDQWVYSGRFFLYDDTRAAVFTVNIRNLTEEDSGLYYCGIYHSWFFDSKTEVNLKIKTDAPVTTSSPLSSSVKMSTSAKVSETSTTLNITSSLAPSPHTLPGSSLFISVVVVLLLLIIAGLIALFLFKKWQAAQGGDSSSQNGPGKAPVSHTGCDYEEIKDIQLPTNLSDSPNTVYATTQLPTNLSDSSTGVYASVQKGTADSQGLNYAAVMFQKKADCPDSVSVRSNEDHCEYTTVNHLNV